MARISKAESEIERLGEIISDVKVVKANPENIEIFCQALAKAYSLAVECGTKCNKEFVKDYLWKYMERLMDLHSMALSRKVHFKAINLKELLNVKVEMPNNIAGDVCRLVAKAFKISVALAGNRDKKKRDTAKRVLTESVKLFFELAESFFKGERPIVSIMRNKINRLELELRQIVGL